MIFYAFHLFNSEIGMPLPSLIQVEVAVKPITELFRGHNIKGWHQVGIAPTVRDFTVARVYDSGWGGTPMRVPILRR